MIYDMGTKLHNLTAKEVVEKALERSERFGVLLKTSITALLMVSISSVTGQLEGISKIGGIVIIASNIFTTALIWFIHLRKNPKAVYRYVIFIMDALSVQFVVFLYSFASNSPPDYGIEHIGLICTAIGVIIASGAMNHRQLPIVTGAIITLSEALFVVLLVVKKVPIESSPNDVFLQPGIIGTRIILYKLAGYLAVTIAIWFTSRIHDRMVTDLKNYSNQLEDQKNSLDAILLESREVSGSAREMGAMIRKTIGEIKTGIDTGKQKAASVVEVFNEQLIQVKNSTDKTEKMLAFQKNIHEHLLGQKESVMRNKEMVNRVKKDMETIDTLSKNANGLTGRLLLESGKGEKYLLSVVEATLKVKQASDDIAKAVGLIQDIADKTNLLSLNASITAAHAGEAGKSFNVVAGEIRKLAENSARNSISIDELLRNMETQIDQGVKLTNEGMTQFKEIRGGATESSDSIRKISEINSDLSAGYQETHRLAEEINERADNVKSLNEKLDASANDVYRSLQRLLDQTGTGAKTVGELDRSIEGIRGNIDRILAVTESNEETIEKLIRLLPSTEDK
jgi:methyl-accepting chemotaxis protein